MERLKVYNPYFEEVECSFNTFENHIVRKKIDEEINKIVSKLDK